MTFWYIGQCPTNRATLARANHRILIQKWSFIFTVHGPRILTAYGEVNKILLIKFYIVCKFIDLFRMYWLVSISQYVYTCASYGSFRYLCSVSKWFINSLHQIFIEHQAFAKYLAWLGARNTHLNIPHTWSWLSLTGKTQEINRSKRSTGFCGSPRRKGHSPEEAGEVGM